MKVALNALCITNRSGTGRYAFGLVDGFVRSGLNDVQLTVFIPAGFSMPIHWWDCESIRFYTVSIKSALYRIYWEQITLPKLLKQLDIHILHSPAFICPCIFSDNIHHIITVHDLAYRSYPQTIPALRRMYLKALIERSIHKASIIITDSQIVAEELKQAYPNANTIRAIHLGVDDEQYTLKMDEQDQGILHKHQINKPYFLFVGTIEPRKNLDTVLQAFQHAKEKGLEHRFVVIGRYGWMMDKSLLQQDGVLWLGHIDESELPTLYRHTDALLAPSFYEGFDLPTVEALACGSQVIASDISVHREVLGENALFVNTTDIYSWVSAMMSCNKKQNRNQTVRTWLKVAKDTMKIYQQSEIKKG